MERAGSAQVGSAVRSIIDELRPIPHQVSGSRPRLEVLVLLVLVLLVGFLVVGRIQSREDSDGDRSLEETFTEFDQKLQCLKSVMEETFAREFVDVTATADPGLLGGTAAVHPDDVVVRVQEVRELTFDRIPEPIYLSAPELSARAAGYAEDYPVDEAAHDSELLSSLGAVPDGTDLKELTATALGEQVAGFYDTESKQIVVSGDPEAGLDPIQELTLAHEFEHALADQALGLPVDEDFPPDGAEDSTLAATALVEGDATLTMALYSFTGAVTAPSALFGADLAAVGGLTRLPSYLQRSLIFPYAEGLAFVCGLYLDGGWTSVNQAYADPPSTTAQILFPERYESQEEAVDPRNSASPGAGWTNDEVRALGAADLLFLFEAPGDRADRALEDPLKRAAGWAGGEVHLWSRGDLEHATGMLLVERTGEQDLCGSMRQWYRSAFPGGSEVRRLPGEKMASEGSDQAASLRCAGNEVRMGIADDLGVARRVIGS